VILHKRILTIDDGQTVRGLYGVDGLQARGRKMRPERTCSM